MHTGIWREKPKGKELLARHRYRWEVNFNIDYKLIELYCVD